MTTRYGFVMMEVVALVVMVALVGELLVRYEMRLAMDVLKARSISQRIDEQSTVLAQMAAGRIPLVSGSSTEGGCRWRVEPKVIHGSWEGKTHPIQLYEVVITEPEGRVSLTTVQGATVGS